MADFPRLNSSKRQLKIHLYRNRKLVWTISFFALVLSLIGLFVSMINPSINAPLRPGLDFTGGTQIQLERICENSCSSLDTSDVSEVLRNIDLPNDGEKVTPKLSQSKVQLLDDSKSLVLRLPFLSASQGQKIISSMQIFGPFQPGGQAVDTIGPSLGKQLLKSSIISLCAAFIGIALYISIRYDRRFALLALIALSHDIIIVCGIFSWLGLFIGLEVDSLFAVALLTIAGYSVNDTVVVFDRIRERSREDSNLSSVEQIDSAVSSTLTRTLYTSGTTLLPLIALIFFGGPSLYWFAIALALGVVVGSWSSIALAPSLLGLGNESLMQPLNDIQDEQFQDE